MNLHKHTSAAYQKASPSTPKAGDHTTPEGFPKEVNSGKTPPAQKIPPSQNPEKPSRQEIARYLVLIGAEEATKILAHLSEAEVEALAREISTVGTLSSQDADRILAKFRGLVRGTVSGPARGGEDLAREILCNAFGSDKADSIIKKIANKEDKKFFTYLIEMQASQVANLLQPEPVHVKTMVLAYLPPVNAAGIIKHLSQDEQKQIVIRLASMKKVDKDVLSRVDEALYKRVQNSSVQADSELDGRTSLASIMKFLDPGLEQSLLEDLKIEAPALAQDIRDRLFTIDTILLVDDRDFQGILATMDDKNIAMILKGKDITIKKKFLDNVSDIRSLSIEDEIIHLGPQLKRDVDRITREFIAELKYKELSGAITVRRDDDEYI